jgi:C-lobe and N-lobe beta barrels of Tf-binding protein B
VTRFALFSACASLALLGACKDATTDSSSVASLGGSPAPTTTPEAVKNTSLVTPVVQQTYTTFSANQRLSYKGKVGNASPLVLKQPDGSFPQATTDFSYGLPANGLTIKPPAYVTGDILYEGSQPVGTVADVSVDFNPRDAVYTVTAKTGSIDSTTRFQDPAHRTVLQQQLVPTLSNYKYAEAGTGADTTVVNARSTTRDANTIFVRDVGTGARQTQYVTLAGYVKQKYSEKESTVPSPPDTQQVEVTFDTDISRSIFAYGINTAHKDIPKSGSSTYAGDLYAHIIISPQLAINNQILGNLVGDDFRSVVGTSTSTVDFGTGKIGLTLAGGVVGYAGDTRSFNAVGAADIFKPTPADTVPSRFSGAITSWSFGAYNKTITVPTAASTVEGGFFGPKAEEIGGAFRIIGNRPEERIDILGAFAGKKN